MNSNQPHVTKSSLGVTEWIGQGGQGIVFDAPAVSLTFGVTAVYKEYLPQIRRTIDFAILGRSVDFLYSLDTADQHKLLEISAWPAKLVESAGTLSGFLMPRLPDDFRIAFKLPSGKSETVNSEVQHILNKDAFLLNRGIVLSEADRYTLLRELAEALIWLHSHDIVVGDLSAKNVLFCLNPYPHIYLIDCDSARVQGQSASPQAETPGWDIRSVSTEELATPATDAYKFGLLALRLLGQDQTIRDVSQLLGHVPDEVRQLVRTALSSDAFARPGLHQWIRPLAIAARGAAVRRVRPQSGAATSPTSASAGRPLAPGCSSNPSVALPSISAGRQRSRPRLPSGRVPTRSTVTNWAWIAIAALGVLGWGALMRLVGLSMGRGSGASDYPSGIVAGAFAGYALIVLGAWLLRRELGYFVAVLSVVAVVTAVTSGGIFLARSFGDDIQRSLGNLNGEDLRLTPVEFFQTSSATSAATVPSTPSVAPPGAGVDLTIGKSTVTLLAFVIRAPNGSETDALAFGIGVRTDATDSRKATVLSASVVAKDSVGLEYRDYYVVSRDYYLSKCSSGIRPPLGHLGGGPDWSPFLDPSTAVASGQPNTNQVINLHLQRAGTSGSCDSGGSGMSRVPVSATYVDVQLSIRMEGSSGSQVFPITFRLGRDQSLQP